MPGPGVSHSLSIEHGKSALFFSVNCKLMTAPPDNDSQEQYRGLDGSPDAATEDRSAYLVERVYLLDDDPDVLKVVESMLQISGYTVRAYGSPTEFLAATNNLAAWVVSTDTVMHGGNAKPVVCLSGVKAVSIVFYGQLHRIRSVP